MRRLVSLLSLTFIVLVVLLAFTGCGKKEVVEQQPEPTNPLQRERFRLIAKVKQVTGKKRLDLSLQVAADLDKAIAEKADASYTVGSNLTDTGKAYRLYWVDETFLFEEYEAADARWEGIQPDSLASQRRGADPAKPAVPSLSQQETFARGLGWFISDASAGEPVGTVVYGQKIPVKFRLRRGAKLVPAAISLQLPTTSGSAASIAYPELSNAPPDQQITYTFDWTRGLSPGSRVHGVLAMVELTGEGKLPGDGEMRPVSNPVVVSFRVAAKSPAAK